MNDNVFVDTNVLIYGYSYAELEKQSIARKLITKNNSFISTQVLQELANTLIKKFRVTPAQALRAVNESVENNRVNVNSKSTIMAACAITARYGFSFYDSLIVAAALYSPKI